MIMVNNEANTNDYVTQELSEALSIVIVLGNKKQWILSWLEKKTW